MRKTSIRFFEDIPVRAIWDEDSFKWWFCAMDIAEALTHTKNPRVYWATIKRRNTQLIAICKQLKLEAHDENIFHPRNQKRKLGSGIATTFFVVPFSFSFCFY